MLKKLFAIIPLLCLSVGLFAEGITVDGGFAGLGPELNAHTRNGIATGGQAYVGLDFGPEYSAGVKIGYFYDIESVIAIEPVAFFRYYLPWGVPGLFAQAEAGCVIYVEYGKPYPAFSGGLSAGWRFTLVKDWFLEPVIRAGYPYAWGVGVMIGFQWK